MGYFDFTNDSNLPDDEQGLVEILSLEEQLDRAKNKLAELDEKLASDNRKKEEEKLRKIQRAVEKKQRELKLIAEGKLEKKSPGRPGFLGGADNISRLVVLMKKSEHTAFKVWCQLRGLEMSELVREYILGLVGGEEELEDQSGGVGFGQWLRIYQEGDKRKLSEVLARYREEQAAEEEENSDNQ